MTDKTVSEVAREISRDEGVIIAPHVISNLFYRRQLDDARCPVVNRVRLIPPDYVPEIRNVLERSGLLKSPADHST